MYKKRGNPTVPSPIVRKRFYFCFKMSRISVSLFFLAHRRQFVDTLDHQEDTQCHNEEIDGHLDEVTIVPGHRIQRFLNDLRDTIRTRHCFHHRTGGEFKAQLGEIGTTEKPTDRRHQDVVHQRGDDLTESTADDDTNRHIHDISLHGEVFELL